MSKPLINKLILITGASSGIGRRTAQVLSEDGAQVFCTGRNRARLEELGFPFHVADLTSDGACQEVVENAVKTLGGLTTLINCAGVLAAGAMGTDKCDLANFKYNMMGNCQTVFEMMQHAIPHLKNSAAKAGPSIVNVSSVNGLQSFGACASYCASKAAVDQLTRCAALDLAPYGIRVNAINPGVIVTELQKRGGLDETQYQAFLQRSLDTHPLARARPSPGVGDPDDAAHLISFLVSDKAGFITGDCIAVDGGRKCLGAR